MLAKAASYIREYGLLKAGDRVAAGVSGGADSVCLLHVLVRLRDELDLTVCAVHVHHGLRGAEADRDAAFVQALAAEWNVPCRVVHVDVRGYAAENGLSEEEAGRVLRYRALREEAQRLGPSAKIAVGHQKEDQAETILHNLFRGAALKGLSGMAPLGRLGGVCVIRPLLDVSREEIRAYLTENGLSCCEDSTNDTADYTRNRIRRLLPAICGVNARAVDHILAAGERIAQADAYFEERAAQIWAEAGVEQEERFGIPAAVLNGLPQILAGYLARRMITLLTGSVKDITSVHTEQLCGLARMETGRQICLPYGLRAEREYEMIWVGRAARTGADGSFEGTDRPRGITFSRFPYEKNQKIPENRYTKWFDYDKIKDTLSVRHRLTGDYITLKGGHRKSVKSYMTDEKIPRGERERILLLAEGSHVLWIVGYRISEYYKVTEETKEILQAQAYGGDEHGEDTCIDSGGGCQQEDQRGGCAYQP